MVNKMDCCPGLSGGRLKHVIMHRLAEKSYTGYSLCKEIEAASGHKPSFGSIYPILESLVHDGFVTVKQDGRRKIYSMTPEGKKTVELIKKHYSQNTNIVKEHMKLFCDILGHDPKEIDQMMELFERLNAGDDPLGKTSGVLFEFRKLIVKMALEGKITRNQKKVIKIFEDTRARLEMLK